MKPSEVPVAVQIHGPALTSLGDRRLLLLSYNFPPGAAVGGLRWQKFAAFAGEFGWSVDVITVAPRAGTRRDDARLADLPAGTRVFGVEPVPSALLRLEERVRHIESDRPEARNTTALPFGRSVEPETPPEASLLTASEIRWQLHTLEGWRRAYAVWRHYAEGWAWARPAGRLASAMARGRPYEAVIGSGPPHQALVAAASAARAGGTHLALDFRDPWSLVPRVPAGIGSPLWFALARRWERRAITGADLIVMNTELASEAMRRLYPAQASRILTVMNGLDDEPVPEVPDRTRFILAYAGNIYIDRSPAVLFRAAARLIRERNLRPEQLTLEFMGHADSLNGLTVEQLAEREGLLPFLRRHPPAPRAQAMRFLAGASLLVSLPQGTPLSTPSKVYEYMLFKAWHLILARAETATAALLRDTSMPVVDPEDENGIYSILADRFARFERGERPGLLTERGRFLRSTQARRFFAALAERVGQG